VSAGTRERTDDTRWSGTSELTLGLEEEVMLVEPGPWSLHQDGDAVLASLEPGLRDRASAETHASALELATGVHGDVAGAAGELAALRERLAAHLAGRHLAAAAAGLHAFTTWRDTVVSRGARYRALQASLHGLSEREPTFALHVHVAVPDPEGAVSVMNGLRGRLPLLLALSGNSPFWQGRDTGMASMRLPLFQAFPRTGPPRAFADYRDWVGCVEALVGSSSAPNEARIVRLANEWLQRVDVRMPVRPGRSWRAFVCPSLRTNARGLPSRMLSDHDRTASARDRVVGSSTLRSRRRVRVRRCNPDEITVPGEPWNACSGPRSKCSTDRRVAPDDRSPARTAPSPSSPRAPSSSSGPG